MIRATIDLNPFAHTAYYTAYYTVELYSLFKHVHNAMYVHCTLIGSVPCKPSFSIINKSKTENEFHCTTLLTDLPLTTLLLEVTELGAQ